MIKIEYKGITNTQYDLVVSHLTRRKRAKEKTDRYKVEGRNGAVIDRLGTYESYTRDLKLTNITEDRLDLVYKWLDGSGILRTSEDEGGYFYAHVISAVEKEEIACGHYEFDVTFEVEPFFYVNSGLQKIVDPLGVSNIGNVYSEPIITLYGNGRLTLEVNDQEVILPLVTDHATIDSRLKTCHKDGLPVKMIGEYPVLNLGNTKFKTTGTTKLEVTPKWRKL